MVAVSAITQRHQGHLSKVLLRSLFRLAAVSVGEKQDLQFPKVGVHLPERPAVEASPTMLLDSAVAAVAGHLEWP